MPEVAGRCGGNTASTKARAPRGWLIYRGALSMPGATPSGTPSSLPPPQRPLGLGQRGQPAPPTERTVR
ncbi:hypothetical protein SEA_OTTAWA_16 [Arthrobacter phage Ottawa]|nr:hypothetical protein SEA_KHARCHO_16 [Arthrobacter phage Kharcho]WIC89248.1 hypothetical protein SEA_OTTAWA_16 [Arthrobacter phage Ottawa]